MARSALTLFSTVVSGRSGGVREPVGIQPLNQGSADTGADLIVVVGLSETGQSGDADPGGGERGGLGDGEVAFFTATAPAGLGSSAVGLAWLGRSFPRLDAVMSVRARTVPRRRCHLAGT